MTFDMGAQTLAQLTTATSSASDDLGANVHKVYDAAAPLEGNFNGEGRAAFDRFKADVDDIATELNAALASVLAGIDGMNTAYVGTEQNQAQDNSTLHGNSHFELARWA
jgi:uncharacterized protein YukE